MDIDLHIERLIVHGIDVPHGRRPLLQVAVGVELARLLAADGLAPRLLSGGALARVRGGEFQLTGDGDPAQLGGQIAQAVYGGIGR